MRIALGAFLFFFLAMQSQAAIYYYKDEQGGIHAVDSPDMIPEQYREKIQTAKRIDQDQSRLTMQLQRSGNSLLVPMRFGNGPASVTATLILDTGANLTVLPSRVAKALGLTKTRDLTMNTAGGEAQAYMVRLPELSLQNFTVRDLQVAVHDIPNLGPAEGLLGVDFLGNFKMSIDTQSGALTLDKK